MGGQSSKAPLTRVWQGVCTPGMLGVKGTGFRFQVSINSAAVLAQLFALPIKSHLTNYRRRLLAATKSAGKTGISNGMGNPSADWHSTCNLEGEQSPGGEN